MTKIAVDVVLLPSEEMADKAIEANRKLRKQYADRIVLDKDNCLPHVSLAMGCIDESDIFDIEKILRTLTEKCLPQQLSVIAIHTGTNSVREKVSVFQIERTEALQSLHEEAMRKLTPYLSYDVTAETVLSPPPAGESTLLWIKNYPQKASFENFFPHITIGYGQINDVSLPIKFVTSKVALCHLGNHCTCRRILASAEFRS